MRLFYTGREKSAKSICHPESPGGTFDWMVRVPSGQRQGIVFDGPFTKGNRFMKVAVAYAEEKQQVVLDTDVEEGFTVEQAIHKSGILKKFANLDLTKCKTGIFGKIVPLGQVLSEGDRVEIYRPALGKPPKKGTAAAKGVADAADEAEEEG